MVFFLLSFFHLSTTTHAASTSDYQRPQFLPAAIELNTLLEQLTVPSVRNLIFAVADALIGGQPVPVSSGGGGSTSDLPWDGRRPDENEEAYRRRCMMAAVAVVRESKQSYRRKSR